MDRHSKNNGSIGYSYADWDGNITGSKSTTGYLLQVSAAAIPWQSKKQSWTAPSTAEVEYVALVVAAQQAVWPRQLNQELIGKAKPVMIYEDNQSTITIGKNPQFNVTVKHINIKTSNITLYKSKWAMITSNWNTIKQAIWLQIC